MLTIDILGVHMQLDEENMEIDNLEQITKNLDKNPSNKEKRKYPRIDIIFDVNYEVLIPEKKEVHTHGKDLSLGGISFEISQNDDLKTGMFIIVRFSIKELEGELKAMGKIVRIWRSFSKEENKEKTYCAVKITGIDPIDYEILNSFIREYLSKH